jgi:sugar lactone lactonase YvrE
MSISPLKYLGFTLSFLALAGAVQGQTNAVAVVPQITTVAGNGTYGFQGDGSRATSAELRNPSGIAVDSSGNIYIADTHNHRIRKISAATGVISTVAGNGGSGYRGDGGAATSAELNSPAGIAAGTGGSLLIADSGNSVVRKLNTVTGVISTVAGDGSAGYSGDGGPAKNAKLRAVNGVAVDPQGNLYVADTDNHVIRKVSAANGVITTVAGNGSYGYKGDGGQATKAELSRTEGVAVDLAGNLYIADGDNGVIRKVTAKTGVISTVAATKAESSLPGGIAVDSGGNLYIAYLDKQVVRRLSATSGTIATVAGNLGAGYGGDGGPATKGELNRPSAVALDSGGSLYIADVENNRIRRVSGTVAPVSFPEAAVGSASASQRVLLGIKSAMKIDSISVPKSQGALQEFAIGGIAGCVANGSAAVAAGSICSVTVTFHPGYPGLRQVPLVVQTSAGTFHFGMEGIGLGPQAALLPGVITTAAGNGTQGSSGEGGPATKAELLYPVGVAVDAAGDLFIEDTVIRKVNAATGTITTIAGTERSGFGGIAVNAAGDIYFAAPNNNIVQKISATTGAITTVAGNGRGAGVYGQYYSGDGGPATKAELNDPLGVALDSFGNLYIADTENCVIRKVDAATGIISTVAGNGIFGYSGDGGPATKAEFNFTTSVVVDSAGNLYIADYSAHVRKVSAATGIISPVAGGGNGCARQSDRFGDGCLATEGKLEGPMDVALDAAGNLYIADYFEDDSRGTAVFYSFVRKVSAATGIMTTIAGDTAGTGTNSNGGPATSAQLYTPSGIALDATGNLYIADSMNYRVRKVSLSTPAMGFPHTGVGDNSGARTFAVANIGNTALKLSGITPSAHFKIDGSATNCSISAAVAAGSSCKVGVVFSPTSTGALHGTLTLKDNALNLVGASQQVALSGTGEKP